MAAEPGFRPGLANGGRQVLMGRARGLSRSRVLREQKWGAALHGRPGRWRPLGRQAVATEAQRQGPCGAERLSG